jgi:hypothetical protein
MRIALAAAFVLATTPAFASVGLFCSGPDGVSVDAPLSGGAGLRTMSAVIQAGGRTWTTEAALEDPQAIVPAQSFSDGNLMWLDFSGTNIEANVVEIRLFSASEGAIGGTLNIPGVGSWVLTCDIG